jgi:hypothetical protein
MQGAITRARLQHRPARFHRAPYRCIPVTTTTCLPERRVHRGGGVQWCGSSAATGERARAVSEVRAAGARGGDARPPPQGEGDVAAGVAEAPSSGGGAKRGSVVGAAALVVGTSIGSGILAVPQRTAPAVSRRTTLHLTSLLLASSQSESLKRTIACADFDM